MCFLRWAHSASVGLGFWGQSGAEFVVLGRPSSQIQLRYECLWPSVQSMGGKYGMKRSVCVGQSWSLLTLAGSVKLETCLARHTNQSLWVIDLKNFIFTFLLFSTTLLLGLFTLHVTPRTALSIDAIGIAVVLVCVDNAYSLENL